MLSIDIHHSSHVVRVLEDDLLTDSYVKPRSCERYYEKDLGQGNKDKVRLINRAFISTIAGYNPSEIRFHFIPNTEELDFAKRRVIINSGKVYVLGGPQ